MSRTLADHRSNPLIIVCHLFHVLPVRLPNAISDDCQLRVVRVLAAAPQSLVKMILDGSHLHSLSGGGPVLGAAATAGPAPAPAQQFVPASCLLMALQPQSQAV